jgi:MFS family permease
VTRPGKLAFLSILYAAQGMPLGFQIHALPIHLDELGVDLAVVGFTGLLALPFFLKFLWAPLVERTGRRRPWLIGAQLALLALCVAGALSPPEDSLVRLALVILLMNLVAATQDIAVDGVAVDLLRLDELGLGNAAQVAGYKVGMLLAGGLSVVLAARLSWAFGFVVMAAIVLLALAAVLAWREPPPAPRAREARASFRSIFAALAAATRLPGHVWVLLVVATYKLGESISDTMWKRYLYRIVEVSGEDVAVWFTAGGMIPSILGSVAGGVLAMRTSPIRAIAIAATLRAGAVSAYAIIAATGTTDFEALVAASWAEEAFGGALTTAMFAFMMQQIDARIGATHYTVLASLEVAGKFPGSLLSGVVAKHLGFATCFAAAATLSVAYLPLVWLAHRASTRTVTA